MDKLHNQGIITKVEREAVSNINGHSSKICLDYYLKRDRNSDVHQARNAFNKCLGIMSSNSSNSSNSSADNTLDKCDATNEMNDTNTLNNRDNNSTINSNWLPNDPNVSIEWGAKHPDFTNKLQRSVWSPEEINYIGKWCSDTINLKPQFRKTIVSKCWHHIKNNSNDNSIRDIFHINHILDTTRLRHGYRSAIQSGKFDSLKEE
jgi:hypothetical protein